MDISYESVENAACSDLEASYYGMSRRYFMPYLDHCYATGLPTVQFDSRPDSPPLPLTEPLAAFVDIEEVGMRGASHHPHSSLGVVSSGTSSMTNKRMAGNNYGSIKNNSSNNNNSGNAATGGNSGGGDAEVDPYEGSVTRCICDFQHDDGYMICCDRCGVWQHVECMGVDGKHIPDSYLCELCYPRIVDKRRAVRIQSKKKEELEMEDSSASADDSLEEESKRTKKRGGRKKEQGRRKSTADSSGGGQSHKKAQQQQRRKRSSSEMDGKKHSDGSFHSPHKGTEQKRSRPQSYTGSSSSAIDNLGSWGLNSGLQRSSSGSQHSAPPSGVPIQPNTYSSEVINLLMMKVKTMGSSNNSNVVAIAQQLSRKCFKVVTYEGSSKGLEAVETIKPNHTVAEYTGKTVMRREYEKNCQSDLSYPFTVCYMGINGVELCVDSTEFGNEAKFVRRSCTPNAKVVHLLEKTGLRFFICATKTIPSGKEITIPFYFDYHRSSVEVKCPCGKSSCMVAKHFKRSTGRSATTSGTATPGLNSTNAAITNLITSAASSLRPVRQSKKRVLEEFMDNGADEDDDGGEDEEEESQFLPGECSESVPRAPQHQFGKKKSGAELQQQSLVVDQQRETKTPTTFMGRLIKMPRGRHAPQSSANNSNSSGNKSPSLTSSIHAHLDLAKTSLDPISTNVGDDIALFNKLSSVDAMQHAKSLDAKSKFNETSKSQHDQKLMPSKNLRDRDESQMSSAAPAASRRKLQVSQTKEAKAAEDETKEQYFQNNGKMSDSGDRSDSGTDKPAPKERRKNSKLLAEIQTFLKSDKLEEDKDSGGKKVSTREQRKIEAAERRFEKIEKSSAAKVNPKSATTSASTSSTASPNSKSMRTRSVQQQDDKKDKAAEIKKSGLKISVSATKASKSVTNVKSSGVKSKQEEATPPGRPGRPPNSKKTIVADMKINKTSALLPTRSGRPSRK